MRIRHTGQSRNGFTLVELLLVIAVIGILIGMISAAVIPALKRANEAAIQTEMKQMELAIESFNNDFGFYPPTFGVGAGAKIQTPSDLLPYLNLIAPNHAENSSRFPGSSNYRLVDWYTNVGQHLDERSSLAFWLSGLCKSKQYPLTGGASETIAGYGVNKYSDGSDFPVGLVVERDNYFELRNSQLSVEEGGAVAVYNQAYGVSDGDLAYRYLDHTSYFPRAYYDGPLPSTLDDYINPKSFQLVTYGMDGEPGMQGSVFAVGSRGEDNLCNFADGRLDVYVNSRQ